MKKLFVILLMAFMVVVSVSAESYVDFSNLWDDEKQVMTISDEELEETMMYYLSCPEEEKPIVLEIISVIKEQFFCVAWAEEHFKIRDGHELTLTYEEYDTYMMMRDHSVKRHSAALTAYDALEAVR